MPTLCQDTDCGEGAPVPVSLRWHQGQAGHFPCNLER